MLSMLLRGAVGRSMGLGTLNLAGQRFVLIGGDWRMYEVWIHRWNVGPVINCSRGTRFGRASRRHFSR
jgi:hypothetical protein